MSKAKDCIEIKIDRTALYSGMRSISRVMKVSRGTLRNFIDNHGLPAKKRPDGVLVISGEDLYAWYGELPRVKKG